MARLFSIEIPFQNQQYSTLMSIRNEGTMLFCIVRYIDKKIPFVLPGDTLVIHPKEGVQGPHPFPPDFEQALIQCTCRATSI